MHWVIQSNLYNEAGYVAFMNALERLNLPKTVVKPVPFTNRLLPADFDSMTDEVDETPEPNIPTDSKVIVMGSTTMVRIAREREWTPGAYLNENFNFKVWCSKFGYENTLNWDAAIRKAGEPMPIELIRKLPSYVFLRPIDDSKAFTGMVKRRDKALSWLSELKDVKEEPFSPLHKNTEILIASAKNIYVEYRFFVIKGKVVTGSMYKRGQRVYADPKVDQEVIDFAQKMVDKWQPAKAFVIDIADTEQGFKVIEINNLNSAGFYASNCQKIIEELEKLEGEN